jgi:hypothetical protein
MGGADAPDSLKDAPLTQVWLASGPEAMSTGGYYYHMKPQALHPDARNTDIQQLFLEKCYEFSGVKFKK